MSFRCPSGSRDPKLSMISILLSEFWKLIFEDAPHNNVNKKIAEPRLINCKRLKMRNIFLYRHVFLSWIMYFCIWIHTKADAVVCVVTVGTIALSVHHKNGRL